MDILNKGNVSRGKAWFWGMAIAVIGLQAVPVLILLLKWGTDLLIGSVWVQLLGLMVGSLGVARGSQPVRYLLVFFLGVGFVQNALFIQGLKPLADDPWMIVIYMLLASNMLMSGALGYWILLSNHFQEWFKYQQARNFGLKVRMSGNEPSIKKDIHSAKSNDIPTIEKDELGIFEDE